MKLYIVIRDLGDGDQALDYFPTEERANEYMQGRDDCYAESNPHELDVDALLAGKFRFDDE